MTTCCRCFLRHPDRTALFPPPDSRAEPERATPSPMDPEEIEVNISFQPDPTDLVLSSVPGGELFNPRKHRFSEDELKPQPMIKKAKKVFVAEDAKVSLNTVWETLGNHYKSDA